jgi:heparan-alpha-glucosaminide N-acetyltransferase
VSTPSPAAPLRPPRVLSIDLLRGADVLLMLFVNEVAGVTGAPAFLLHKTADADGMTITDLVFPAFLFIVGIAVPFALGARLRRGQSQVEVLRHVVTRALALVVMGVLMVNAEHGVGGVLSAPVWNVLMTLGVLLVWGAPDEGWGRLRKPWLVAAGVALLVFVALAYRGVDATGFIQLRPYWWGILGSRVSSGSTAASPWPTRRADSGGPPYRARSSARSSALTARPCSRGRSSGSS